jgi:hypothetical protein
MMGACVRQTLYIYVDAAAGKGADFIVTTSCE